MKKSFYSLFFLSLSIASLFEPSDIEKTTKTFSSNVSIKECGKNRLVALTNDILYHSTDTGKTWKETDIKKLLEAYNKKHEDKKISSLSLNSVVQNPYNPSQLVALTKDPILLHTKNGGDSWKVELLPTPLDMASTEKNGTGPFRFSEKGEVLMAGELLDARNRQFYVTDASLNKLRPLIAARNCYVVQENITCVTNSDTLVLSGDQFTTYSTILEDTASLEYYGGLYISSKAGKLHLSKDGVVWTSTSLPFEEFELYRSGYPNTILLMNKGTLYRASLNLNRMEVSLVSIIENVKDILTEDTTNTPFGFLLVNTDKGTFKSTDNGDTWHETLDLLEQHISLQQAASIARPAVMSAMSNKATFVSFSGGYEWAKVLDSNEFQLSADLLGRILVAGSKSRVQYSTDLGNSWKQLDFGLEEPANSVISFGSGKFGFTGPKSYTLLDLSKIVNGIPKCPEHSIQTVYLDRVTCFNGFRQKLSLLEPLEACAPPPSLELEIEPCECTQNDYECAKGFDRDKATGKCIPQEGQPDSSVCDGKTPLYYTPLGYAIKDGNKCFLDSHFGLRLDEDVAVPCPGFEDDISKFKDPNPKAKLEKARKGKKGSELTSVASATASNFLGHILQLEYLNKLQNPASYAQDEVAVALTLQKEVHLSYNFGKDWQQLAADELFLGFSVKSDQGVVCAFTESDHVVYSRDNGVSWHYFLMPAHDASPRVLFHKDQPTWAIFSADSKDGATLYILTDSGRLWTVLHQNVLGGCFFASNEILSANASLVLCARDTGVYALNDFFMSQREVLAGPIHAFWSDLGALVAVAGNSSTVVASLDGQSFLRKRLPSRVSLTGQRVVMELGHGGSREIFAQEERLPFGRVYKSNRDGDRYIQIASDVAVDRAVGFEALHKFPGVVIVNRVMNAGALRHGDSHNRHGGRFGLNTSVLATFVSYDHGVSWTRFSPPKLDYFGKKYRCTGRSSQECSLHLHGQSEGFSLLVEGVPGLLIGVGSVGDRLLDIENCKTYLLQDAGLTWLEVSPEPSYWTVLDHGSVVVLASTKTTAHVTYSTDLGHLWQPYNFTDTPIKIQRLGSVPSHGLKHAMVVGTLGNETNSTVYNLDFDELLSRSCRFDPYLLLSDFETWTPKNPASQRRPCLFGKEVKYYRKKPDSVCKIGDSVPEDVRDGELVGYCLCEDHDFECDINYEFSHGKCVIYDELKKSTEDQYLGFCKEMPSVIEYELPSGFRKTLILECDSKLGLLLDTPVLRACPGKQREYDDLHIGLRGAKFLFLLVLVLGGAYVVGWFTVRYMIGHRGQIRLREGNLYMEPHVSLGRALRFQLVGLGKKAVGLVFGLVAMVAELVRESNDRMRSQNYERLNSFVVEDDYDY